MCHAKSANKKLAISTGSNLPDFSRPISRKESSDWLCSRFIISADFIGEPVMENLPNCLMVEKKWQILLTDEIGREKSFSVKTLKK